ncbi:MAG: hypothetical protein ACTSSE_12460 [Candidatus Thorarchaeota archaeon]
MASTRTHLFRNRIKYTIPFYHKILEESLYGRFDRTSVEEKQNLAKQIALFLNELHPLRIILKEHPESQELQDTYSVDWMQFYKKVKFLFRECNHTVGWITRTHQIN